MLYVYMHMKLAYEYFNAWIDKHLWSTGIRAKHLVKFLAK